MCCINISLPRGGHGQHLPDLIEFGLAMPIILVNINVHNEGFVTKAESNILESLVVNAYLGIS